MAASSAKGKYREADLPLYRLTLPTRVGLAQLLWLLHHQSLPEDFMEDELAQPGFDEPSPSKAVAPSADEAEPDTQASTARDVTRARVLHGVWQALAALEWDDEEVWDEVCREEEGDGAVDAAVRAEREGARLRTTEAWVAR